MAPQRIRKTFSGFTPNLQIDLKRPCTSTDSIHSTCRGQRDLQSRKDILHIEGKEIFYPSSLQDLTKAFQAFQLQDLPRAFQYSSRHSICKTFQGHPSTSMTFQTFQSFMTFSLQALLHVPALPVHSSTFQCYPVPSSASRDSTPFQHSPIRMHILHIDWFLLETSSSTS